MVAVPRALTGEARAVVRLASLLPRDLQPVVPPTAAAGDDVVVLVHGFFATAGVLRPLRARIEQIPRTHTATFSYGPNSGVESIARSVGRLLDDLDGGVSVHLVGHSMGGLAVRWFVQQVRTDPRVVQTITIATPFQGARGARLMPGQPGRDLRAGSFLLERLGESAGASSVPHLSIFAAADTAVGGATVFPAGERLVVPECGHNGSLFHPSVLDAVADRIRCHGGARRGFRDRRRGDP